MSSWQAAGFSNQPPEGNPVTRQPIQHQQPFINCIKIGLPFGKPTRLWKIYTFCGYIFYTWPFSIAIYVIVPECIHLLECQRGLDPHIFFLVWHSLLVGEMTVLMAANISQEAAGADASPSIPYGNLLTLTILAHVEQTPCKDL